MLHHPRRILPRSFNGGSRLFRHDFQGYYTRYSFAHFAQGRGLQYWSETMETERIQDMLSYYGLQRWGFVIYRCTYGDDNAWGRFMHHLNARKDAVLRDTYDDNLLAQQLNWNVQQDPSLDHATRNHVRGMFKSWVATSARAEMPASAEYQDKLQSLLYENPRYKYCIHVDAESMHSVLDGPSPTEPDLSGISYVNLIRADEAWEAWEIERVQALAIGEDDPQDEGEPEIEGRTSLDVGWMRVSPDGLIPGAFEALVNDRIWRYSYIRPNEGVLHGYV